jgi:hypothetical protein
MNARVTQGALTLSPHSKIQRLNRRGSGSSHATFESHPQVKGANGCAWIVRNAFSPQPARLHGNVWRAALTGGW